MSQLVRRATERDIRKYFEQVGKVRKVELITDRGGASKGIAYVEFKKLESVPVRRVAFVALLRVRARCGCMLMRWCCFCCFAPPSRPHAF